MSQSGVSFAQGGRQMLPSGQGSKSRDTACPEQSFSTLLARPFIILLCLVGTSKFLPLGDLTSGDNGCPGSQ